PASESASRAAGPTRSLTSFAPFSTALPTFCASRLISWPARSRLRLACSLLTWIVSPEASWWASTTGGSPGFEQPASGERIRRDSATTIAGLGIRILHLLLIDGAAPRAAYR